MQFFTVSQPSFSNIECLEKISKTGSNLLAIDILTCKTIYRSLIDHQNFSPPMAEKRLIECGFDIHERQKYILYPFS